MKRCGIDLGTTNSCIVVVDESGNRVIADKQGNKTFPSVVYMLSFLKSMAEESTDTVLSLATTRSVCTVKIQFRPLRLVRRNAVPFSSAATLNLSLNAPIQVSRRNALARSTVLIPVSRNCHVPKLRSDRPRACGE